MNKMIGIAVLALAVAGCSTTTPAERRAHFENSCTGYGFKPGTEAYANCLMQLDRDGQADDQRRLDNAAAGLQRAAQSMQTNRPVTCNTFGTANRGGFGSTYGSATTTCY